MNKTAPTQRKLLNLCIIALLLAMQIVLARFAAINIGPNTRFSFSFIPVVIAARLFGAFGGVAVYGLGDFLGAMIFPTTGAYFPGYTLTAVIAGLIFGLLLARKNKQEGKAAINLKISLSVILTQLLCSFLLNSFWRSFQSGTPYGAILITRIPQCLIIGALQLVFMILFLDKIVSAVDSAMEKSSAGAL